MLLFNRLYFFTSVEKNTLKNSQKTIFSVYFCNLDGWLLLVVGVKADYLTRDLGLWVGCPPWGSF